MLRHSALVAFYLRTRAKSTPVFGIHRNMQPMGHTPSIEYEL